MSSRKTRDSRPSRLPSSSRALLSATALGGALLLALPPAASADETDCRGSIGAQTVDSLRVPRGAACELAGTVVSGSIEVEREATLRAHSIRVAGNLKGDRATRVVVERSELGGSFEVEEGGGAELIRSKLAGDVQLDSNEGPAQRLEHNDIDGSVQVVSNDGGVEISRNLIDDDLECTDNVPAPGGGGNVVRGDAEGQCASLAGGTPSQAGPDAGLIETVEAGPPPARPEARSRTRSRPRARVVRVGLRCIGRVPCTGRVVLRSRGRRVGSRRFVIAGGAREVVRVKINRRGMAVLRRRGRLRVRVTAITRVGAIHKTMVIRA